MGKAITLQATLSAQVCKQTYENRGAAVQDLTIPIGSSQCEREHPRFPRTQLREIAFQ